MAINVLLYFQYLFIFFQVPLCVIYSIFFLLLGPHRWHMEVPRLAAESELTLTAYVTDTAMLDVSCIWFLHCSLGQCQIRNPLSEARDRTCIFTDTSQVLNPLSKWELLHYYFYIVMINSVSFAPQCLVDLLCTDSKLNKRSISSFCLIMTM